MDLTTIFSNIQGGEIIWAVLSFTALDAILGILRALKKHHFKSSINKSGVINKCGVVISIVFFYVLDLLIGLHGIGFAELFGSTILLSELISIAVNLQHLDVPLPNAVKNLISKFADEENKSKAGEQ